MNTKMSTTEAMNVLRSRGIVKVDVHFSGGNDEGGADGFTAFDAEGKEVALDLDSNAYEDQEFDPATKRWKPIGWTVHSFDPVERKHGKRPATPEEIEIARLRDALEAPIYEEYGGFAGEFYVDGTCTWDVAAGRSEMHGSYGHMTYDDF